jgi:hypothetical protein
MAHGAALKNLQNLQTGQGGFKPCAFEVVDVVHGCKMRRALRGESAGKRRTSATAGTIRVGAALLQCPASYYAPYAKRVLGGISCIPIILGVL